MLKKLRWHFILAAMTIFSVVTFVIAAAINIINYSVTTSKQDHMIEGILEYEQMTAAHPENKIPMISEMSWAVGPEADFTTRFFIVYCDSKGNIEAISSEHISSVDDTAIRSYAQTILSKECHKGYYKEYRYHVDEQTDCLTITFLNVSNELRFMKSLFVVSLVTALISLMIVFFLIVIYSHKAIDPYAKNIEKQKQFITDAGHELKTPLTSIATSADILAMEYAEDEWVINIQKQTARLTHLVGDLVALSKLDEETPFLEKKVFNLSEAVWEASEPFAALARAKGKIYNQSIEENLMLYGDRNAICQMLSVLLDNAIKYSNDGGKIYLRVYRKLHRIYCVLYNTCELQNISDLNRLFDRFYRPDESRTTHTGGTGIGLSMAKAIVEAHGGKISAHSQNNEEIFFKIVL